MLDYKTTTFLVLCEQMNYRKTAEILHMTQPAVTQHIHALEKIYGCPLFQYDRRKLSMTPQAKLLERHLRKVRYEEEHLRLEMQKQSIPELKLGATKSIGDYMISDKIIALVESKKCRVQLLVDNTQALLHHIRNGSLDIAMVEGEFDKNTFGSTLMKTEEFLGICSADHPFAGKEIAFDEVVSQNLILREHGSETRSIFENQLNIHGESIASFSSMTCISSFVVIKDLVAAGLGITFGYRSIANQDPRLALFSLQGYPKTHDLFYVYLKDSHAEELLTFLQ